MSVSEKALPPLKLRAPIAPADPKIYLKTGLEVVSILRKFKVISNNSDVLEIGCGPGRLAMNLVEHLKFGSYTGVDIIKEYVNWCSDNISNRHKNFKFQHVPIYNGEFNRKGIYEASSYKFPFENGSFSSIILHSVFTHMLPPDVENYFSEISRLMKQDGRCYVSAFVFNFNERKNLSLDCRHQFLIPIMNGKKHTGSWAAVISKPEAQTAYDIEYIEDLLARNQLELEGGVKCGRWRGNLNGLTNQDVLIIKHAGRRIRNVKVGKYNPVFDHKEYINDWFKLKCIPTFRNALECIGKFLIKIKSQDYKRMAIYGTGMPSIIVCLSNLYSGKPVDIIALADSSESSDNNLFMDSIKVSDVEGLFELKPDGIIVAQTAMADQAITLLKQYATKDFPIYDLNKIISDNMRFDLKETDDIS